MDIYLPGAPSFATKGLDYSEQTQKIRKNFPLGVEKQPILIPFEPLKTTISNCFGKSCYSEFSLFFIIVLVQPTCWKVDIHHKAGKSGKYAKKTLLLF